MSRCLACRKKLYEVLFLLKFTYLCFCDTYHKQQSIQLHFVSLHIAKIFHDLYDILVASPMSLWLLWWPPAGSSMFMVVVMLLMYSVLHCLYSVGNKITTTTTTTHDCVIKWKHFPRYWPFVRGIHRSPANSPLEGQSRRALIFLWSAPE